MQLDSKSAQRAIVISCSLALPALVAAESPDPLEPTNVVGLLADAPPESAQRRAGLRESAKAAGVADALTTAVGLALGASEFNPLGPVFAVSLKQVALDRIEKLPETEQPGAYATVTSVWEGAAANNMCVAAALLSGGVFGLACPIVGVVWGMKRWDETAHEREFWEHCKLHRTLAGNPDLECVYKLPEAQQVGSSESTEAEKNQ